MASKNKVKHSFASTKNSQGQLEIRPIKVARALSKNWGDIPKKLNDTRAVEIHVLAIAYLELVKKLKAK